MLRLKALTLVRRSEKGAETECKQVGSIARSRKQIARYPERCTADPHKHFAFCELLAEFWEMVIVGVD